MRFILKRVNKDQSIVLDNREVYPCGRDKSNKIICLSPVVSRHHCFFLRTDDHVDVIDLNSANGTYINGIRITPKVQVEIKSSDLLGIGCFNVTDYADQDFVYRLESSPDDITEDDSLFNTSKRKLDITEQVIPAKVAKIGEHVANVFDESVGLENFNIIPESPEVFDDAKEAEKTTNKRCEEIEEEDDKKKIIQENNVEEIESSVEMTYENQKERTIANENAIEIANVTAEKNGSPVENANKRDSMLSQGLHLDLLEVSLNFNATLDPKLTSTPTSKIVKEEPKLSYSQIDCDNFNDDEDIFSVSQKSDSLHNTSDRHHEDKFGILNLEDVQREPQKDLFHSQDEEDDVIELSDDDENNDNNPWLSRLYHSQMLNESPINNEEKANVMRLGDALEDLNRLKFLDGDDEEPPRPKVTEASEKKSKTSKKEKQKENREKGKDRESSKDRKTREKSSKHKVSSRNDSDDSCRPRKTKDSHSDDSERRKHREKSEKNREKTPKTSDKSTKVSEKSAKIRQKSPQTSKNSEKISEKPPHISKKSSESSEKLSNKKANPTLPAVSTKSFYTSPKVNCVEGSKAPSIDEASRSTRETLDSISQRLSIDKPPCVLKSQKKIPMIDVSFLAKREQRGVSCDIKRLSVPSGVDTTPTEDALNSSKSGKLTTKDKKELEKQEKIEDYRYKIEQKRRRLAYKWAADALPSTNRRRTLLSKEIQQEIKQDRKEKLKKLAEETKKDTPKELSTRNPAKPKAKVSTKSRGDFLAANPENSNKSKTNNSMTKSTEVLDIKDIKVLPKINKIPRGRSKSVESTSEALLKKLNLNNIELKEPTVRLVDIFASDREKKPVEETTEQDSSKEKKRDDQEDKEKSKSGRLRDELREKHKEKDREKEREKEKEKEKENVAPNDIKKKRVTFSSAKPEIREFEIDQGNTLKKVVHKDALLPSKFSRQEKKAASQVISTPKLEEFLLTIFQWNPLWLSEQMSIKEEPPVVDHKNLNPLLSSYVSYEDYYRITAPLLALEVWHSISKEFEQNGCQPKRPPIMASVVANSLARNPVPSTNLFVSIFLVEALVNEQQIASSEHPMMGDLVIYRVAVKRQDGIQHHNIFAYVTNVLPTVIAPFTRFNKALINHVKNPHTVLTYTLMTKSLSCSIEVDNVQKLSTISYLRSTMRMIQALQYLPTSPLLQQILQPNVQEYQLPNYINPENYVLTTNDKLNPRQMEAVLKITETVVRKLPKIALVQGPPGTGKSKVIVNTVTEILYGNNRYASHKQTRILICAPSNAAIDELVYRLMGIRTTLPKDQRFKMVRIGKQESMHKFARSISVAELAKREVERMTTEHTDEQMLESIEHEKNFLKARINAFEYELESAKNKEENYRQYIMRKLAAVKMRYDVLTKPKGTNGTINSRQMAKLQKMAESTILSGADVIACTLSSCYTNQMEAIFAHNKERISVCIVDEATQSAEAETLIPLMLGVNTLVLVGDPNQLPATVISQEAKRLGLDQSLFARIYNTFEGYTNSPVILLDTQYRMSYSISYWPNRYFYAGALKNAANLISLPFHLYRVLNLPCSQNLDRFSNTSEAIFIVNVIITMLTLSNLESINRIIRIGIITPYNNQRTILSNLLKEMTTAVPEALKRKLNIEVNTVDSFQGQERDVIIMSTVRTQGIGFLNNKQRLCVALTRAKHSLFIIGNFRTFERDDMWKSLLTDARSRGVYIDVNHAASPNVIKTLIIR